MNSESNISLTRTTQSVSFLGKPLSIELSRSARRALQSADVPLVVEMQLQFGCLIRKQVNFPNEGTGLDTVPVARQLSLAFRRVVSQSCLIGEPTPPAETLPAQTPGRFIPKWLHLDYRKGSWQGQFGF